MKCPKCGCKMNVFTKYVSEIIKTKTGSDGKEVKLPKKYWHRSDPEIKRYLDCTNRICKNRLYVDINTPIKTLLEL